MYLTDKRTLELCRQGDKEAFRTVVATYRQMVFGVALRILGDEEGAKDIVQETFIKMWQGFSSFRSDQSLTAWIYTIATRLCLDTLRKSSKMSRMTDGDEVLTRFAEGSDGPERQMENNELASVVRELTSQLSPKQRAVFTLVCLEGLDTRQVAAITGLDAGKIKNNLYVAKSKIREQLTKLGYGR